LSPIKDSHCLLELDILLLLLTLRTLCQIGINVQQDPS